LDLKGKCDQRLQNINEWYLYQDEQAGESGGWGRGTLEKNERRREEEHQGERGDLKITQRKGDNNRILVHQKIKVWQGGGERGETGPQAESGN